ncbi:MAG: DUF4248 domain-containing protein [Bacteroides sp.]|nr:DUF4248 domain-containing protein [Bacteroides sp.]
MDTLEHPFTPRTYLKKELAQLYAPHLHPETALKKLHRWLRLNPELHRRLYNGREGRNDQFFSKRQVLLIIEYLGEP